MEIPKKAGLYIVSLKNDDPISVNANDPRVADKAIRVTKANCKFGKAKNLAARKKNYEKVFGQHNVIFKPLIIMDGIDEAEKVVLQMLDQYRMRGRTNRKNEWLENISPNNVERIATKALANQKKSNLDFIVFAIKQAKKAQAFGFTRNHCSRNLKRALHQYWQNKTLGLSSISQKENIPRSKAAVGKGKGEVTVEHVVPMMVIVNMLMDLEEPTNGVVEGILQKYFRVLLVTKEEDRKLVAAGLRSTMPKNWDGENIWARYEVVEIELAK